MDSSQYLHEISAGVESWSVLSWNYADCLCYPHQGKQQMTQRREPTLTSAVESLLQNRVQEAAIAGKELQSVGRVNIQKYLHKVITTLQLGASYCYRSNVAE